MNTKPLTLLLLLSCSTSSAQSADDIIAPVLLDRATLSGLGLEPVTADWAPPDRELFRKTVYSGERFDVTVMAGNTARTQWESYDVDEFVYVINGQATLTDETGFAQTFQTGDFFMVPKGFSGEWHSQGNRYFQELIVIMKDRSDSTESSHSRPFLLDKTKISGLDIARTEWAMDPDREVYREVLYDGSELDVAIVAGATATTRITNPMTEEFVYVANGSATLTPTGGEPQTFYTGDFFVVPQGFTGTWTSTGHHLYRELIAIPGN